eukprot:GHVN01051672.1.p1 GENE.GHVN01051672.1~~GHVN01051672.1.p1  ORF type:complete len:705 (+),score=144.20 GHVN01051672.1:1262-3376(+)
MSNEEMQRTQALQELSPWLLPKRSSTSAAAIRAHYKCNPIERESNLLAVKWAWEANGSGKKAKGKCRFCRYEEVYGVEDPRNKHAGIKRPDKMWEAAFGVEFLSHLLMAHPKYHWIQFVNLMGVEYDALFTFVTAKHRGDSTTFGDKWHRKWPWDQLSDTGTTTGSSPSSPVLQEWVERPIPERRFPEGYAMPICVKELPGTNSASASSSRTATPATTPATTEAKPLQGQSLRGSTKFKINSDSANSHLAKVRDHVCPGHSELSSGDEYDDDNEHRTDKYVAVMSPSTRDTAGSQYSSKSRGGDRGEDSGRNGAIEAEENGAHQQSEIEAEANIMKLWGKAKSGFYKIDIQRAINETQYIDLPQPEKATAVPPKYTPDLSKPPRQPSPPKSDEPLSSREPSADGGPPSPSLSSQMARLTVTTGGRATSAGSSPQAESSGVDEGEGVGTMVKQTKDEGDADMWGEEDIEALAVSGGGECIVDEVDVKQFVEVVEIANDKAEKLEYTGVKIEEGDNKMEMGLNEGKYLSCSNSQKEEFIRAMRAPALPMPFPRSVSMMEVAMYKKHLTFIENSKIHGSGIGAGRKFERGELIVDYVGRHVMSDHAADIQMFTHRALKDRRTCLFHLREGLYLDASTTPTIGRIINHSCDPNAAAFTLPLRVGGRPRYVVFFALKDIEAGEEITYDYRCGVLREECKCHSPSCRGLF